MEQAQRTFIVPCSSCGQKNRIADRSGLPCCGACRSPLPPISPVRPVRPVWASPLAFIRYLWQERRLPALYGYWRSWRQYTRAQQRYVAADRRFRLLEEERQRRAEAERQRQEEARQRRVQEERRRQEEERRAREDWIATHQRLQFDQLNSLTGLEFEQRLAILFRHQGYAVTLTRGSGDQGADLILSKGSVRIAVQAKRYTARVGNSAIQELLGGMIFYNCSRGIVVTTSDFTRSAKELAARANSVELWSRSELRAHFMHAFPCDPPAFSWDAYRRLKESL
jgi:restriction endonuclease Mrr